MQQRIEFVARALGQNVNFSWLCREFGISRPTGYRWLNRYREAGSSARLKEKSRRPHHSPRQTTAGIEEKERLWIEKGIDLSEITSNRILRRKDLIAPEENHERVVKRFERKSPNELWQMDFKGDYPLLGLQTGRKRKGRAVCPAHPYGHPPRRSGRSPALPYPPGGHS